MHDLTKLSEALLRLMRSTLVGGGIQDTIVTNPQEVFNHRLLGAQDEQGVHILCTPTICF